MRDWKKLSLRYLIIKPFERMKIKKLFKYITILKIRFNKKRKGKMYRKFLINLNVLYIL